MAVDFQQIVHQIKAIAGGAAEQQDRLSQLRRRAWQCFTDADLDQEQLRSRVEQVVLRYDRNLRCALPVDEPLTARASALPPAGDVVVLAVDGSQIVPDRHAALPFGLINIGGVEMRLNDARAPRVYTRSRLLYGEQVLAADGALLGEGEISLRRDAAERAMLLERARDYPSPLVTLTDGPVELWGAKDPGSAESYRRYLQRYLDELRQLCALDVVLCGYVDKPGANLVVRLLEIALTPEEQLPRLREHHPLRGVSDRWLFARLLGPGERSAVFALQSSSREDYRDDLALHFFYLNSGLRGAPAIARVEIPSWVARDGEKLNLLHAVLVQQCRLLGDYPYLLHRAHETAVVSLDERWQIEQLLSLELMSHGVEIEQPSPKQMTKSQSRSR